MAGTTAPRGVVFEVAATQEVVFDVIAMQEAIFEAKARKVAAQKQKACLRRPSMMVPRRGLEPPRR